MLICNSFTDLINHILAWIGGCLGCYNKPTPVTAVDELSKGLHTPGQTVKRASPSEDFWSTSTYDLESSVLQSHRSISSISISTRTLNPNKGPDGTSSHSEFVNHGLIQWNQTRNQWAASKKFGSHPRASKSKLSGWNVSYASLLGTSRRFSHAVPLSEMVEYLVNTWEHEGLYD